MYSRMKLKLSAEHRWLQPEKLHKFECFQHQIRFKNEVKWRSHMEECVSLLGEHFICTGLTKNGDMCKIVMRSASELIYHMLSEHGLYLCDRCGTKHESLDQLKNHNHTHQNTIFFPVKCTLCTNNSLTVAKHKTHFKAAHCVKDYYNGKLGAISNKRKFEEIGDDHKSENASVSIPSSDQREKKTKYDKTAHSPEFGENIGVKARNPISSVPVRRSPRVLASTIARLGHRLDEKFLEPSNSVIKHTIENTTGNQLAKILRGDKKKTFGQDVLSSNEEKKDGNDGVKTSIGPSVTCSTNFIEDLEAQTKSPIEKPVVCDNNVLVSTSTQIDDNVCIPQNENVVEGNRPNVNGNYASVSTEYFSPNCGSYAPADVSFGRNDRDLGHNILENAFSSVPGPMSTNSLQRVDNNFNQFYNAGVGLNRSHSINNIHQIVHDGYSAFAASCLNLGSENTSDFLSNQLSDIIGTSRIYDRFFDERRRRNSSIESEQNRYFQC